MAEMLEQLGGGDEVHPGAAVNTDDDIDHYMSAVKP